MKDINNIIAKVLSGEANEAETAAFDNWVKLDEKNLSKFLELKSYWESRVRFSHPVSKEEVYQLLLDKLQQEQAAPKSAIRKKLIYAISSVAAVVICILIFTHGRISTTLATDNKFFYNEFTTEAQIDTIILPDKSEVILNKHSKLIYSNKFGKDERKVQIEGEALFKVTKNESLPFIVNLGENNITVLGTTFNVKSHTDKENIDITLLTGSIKFQSDRNQVILSPRQELIFKKNTKQIEVVESDTEAALFWLKGTYRYSSVTLEHLMKTLSKNYNINIQIKTKQLANTTVSGAFYKEQTIDEIFSIISRSLPMQWTHINNNIIIN